MRLIFSLIANGLTNHLNNIVYKEPQVAKFTIQKKYTITDY